MSLLLDIIREYFTGLTWIIDLDSVWRSTIHRLPESRSMIQVNDEIVFVDLIVDLIIDLIVFHLPHCWPEVNDRVNDQANEKRFEVNEKRFKVNYLQNSRSMIYWTPGQR